MIIKISCAHREDLDQNPPSLLCVFNVDKVQSFPLDLCLAPSPGDDIVTFRDTSKKKTDLNEINIKYTNKHKMLT